MDVPLCRFATLLLYLVMRWHAAVLLRTLLFYFAALLLPHGDKQQRKKASSRLSTNAARLPALKVSASFQCLSISPWKYGTFQNVAARLAFIESAAAASPSLRLLGQRSKKRAA